MLKLILTLLVALLVVTQAVNRSFTIRPDGLGFLKDGKDFHYIAGAMHYFRMPQEYWKDRLQKAKLAGLDAIQLYIPWNFHEPEEGDFDFTGMADLEHYLQLIQETGMLALVRAGPYICSEWSFGGLPPWLLRKDPMMSLRSSEPAYYKPVENWMKVLLPKLKKFLYSEGGPIIMVQMENEYGSYRKTCDNKYLTDLYDLGRKELGDDVILYTTDGPSLWYLKCGSTDPRYLATIDFGSTGQTPEQVFKPLVDWKNVTPWVNSELYVGWLDVLGGKHSHVDAQGSANTITHLFASPRVSLAMYMFFGGTNFGFWNGKVGSTPAITSYDYDAPLSEAGDITPKFKIIQKAVAEVKKEEPAKLPENSPKADYGVLDMHPVSHMLFKRTGGSLYEHPVNMEQVRQYEGFAVYSTRLQELKNSQKAHSLSITAFRDYVHVFLADRKMTKFAFIKSFGTYKDVASFDVAPEFDTLVLMAENTGYVNYGGGMFNNVKGVLGKVLLDDKELVNWEVGQVVDPFSISMFEKSVPPQGQIFLGNLEIKSGEEVQDTFVQLDCFTRGIISINGFNLGRYAQAIGPQLRLYVPKTVLKPGHNIVTIVELEGFQMSGLKSHTISFHKEMLWGKRK